MRRSLSVWLLAIALLNASAALGDPPPPSHRQDAANKSKFDVWANLLSKGMLCWDNSDSQVLCRLIESG